MEVNFARAMSLGKGADRLGPNWTCLLEAKQPIALPPVIDDSDCAGLRSFLAEATWAET